MNLKRFLPLAVISLSTALIFQNCSSDFIVMDFDSLGSFASQSVGNAKLRRLSNVEYSNSIRSIVSEQLIAHGGDQNLADNTFASLAAVFRELPADTSLTKLGTNEIATSLSTARFSAYTDIAYALGSKLGNDSNLRGKLIGSCALASADFSSGACVDTFIREFGTLAFRSPPTASEAADLKKSINTWDLLIARVLVHPRFLLHFERDGVAAPDGSYSLTDFEIASRLAFVFWKSAPDKIALNAAAAGSLKTQAGLKAEITRLLSSPKARAALWLFYQQWLGVSRLPQAGSYDQGAPYQAFAAPFSTASLNSQFGNAVVEDGQQYLEYLTWTEPQKLEIIFRSPLIFTTNATLAQIYGVTPRASASAPPVTDPTGHFMGILSRALITQQKPSNNGDINPIQRGVFILQNLLGIELGQPANFADQQQAQLVIPVTSSTRQEVQTKTGQGTCIGCHTTINPVGYGLNHFDALGRYIDTEKRFNWKDGIAQAVATNPVDSNAILPLGGVAYNVQDLPTLVNAMVSSGKLYDGFANYYFQFAFGHLPQSPSDLRLIKQLADSLRTKTVRDSLEQLALSPDFLKTQTAIP